jgi:two-component system, LuxR family, response regulator FixJ
MSESSEPTVYIVDDDAAVRTSLQALLTSVNLRSEVFPSADAFVAALGRIHGGCLLLDVRMPGMSGLELQRLLQQLEVRLPVILITGHGDVPMAVRAMKAGASDFIQKPFNPQELLDRVNACLALDAQAQEAERPREEALRQVGKLTKRELEVMDLVVTGKPSKTIALQLGISEKTVDVHRFHIMRKTGTRTLAELIQLALLAGRSDQT